jgi:regulator of replication initiation timing
MKKLLPITTFLAFAITLYSIFNIGDQHVEVVDENSQLKVENSQLKEENTALVTQNQKLTEEINQVSLIADSALEVSKEKPVQVIVQDKVEAKYGWATPDYVWDILEFQLDKVPTKQQYKSSLLEVLNNKALFYPSEADPELPGILVKRSEIDSLINLKF